MRHYLVRHPNRRRVLLTGQARLIDASLAVLTCLLAEYLASTQGLLRPSGGRGGIAKLA